MTAPHLINRREGLALGAATLLASAAGLTASADAAQQEPHMSNPQRAAGANDAIRPFHVSFPDSALTDLRQRVSATNWPDKETVPDHSQGVQLATMRSLAERWVNGYDWRRTEARINSFPNFITEIDGLDIHFIHVRSRHENALPIIITHGWPGLIIEQMKVIEPLTNPTAHGGTAADAFHVVIPSLPGYGFSGKPTAPGWNPPRIARAWATLMQRLGYTRYVAQGGDWGNAVSENMGLQRPPGLVGIHTNMPAAVPLRITQSLSSAQPPAGLSAEETTAWRQLRYFNTQGLGYAIEMGCRPQTLYALMDSPVGLAAWMLDHDIASEEMIARVFAGEHEGLSKDDVLDNVTLYWLTKTAISSAQLYWDTATNLPPGGFFDPRGVQIPVAVSAFPDEIYCAPRNWVEAAYPHLLHYNKLPRGTHFAAWEQPDLFVQEMRASFRTLRA